MKGTIDVQYMQLDTGEIFEGKPQSASLITRNRAEVHVKAGVNPKHYNVSMKKGCTESYSHSWTLDKEAALDFSEFFAELAKYMD